MSTPSSSSPPSCRCTGLRYCGLCADTERAKAIREQPGALFGADTVVERHFTAAKPGSSCAFAAVPAACFQWPSASSGDAAAAAAADAPVSVFLWLCLECHRVVAMYEPASAQPAVWPQKCEEHVKSAEQFPAASEAFRQFIDTSEDPEAKQLRDLLNSSDPLQGLRIGDDFLTHDEEASIMSYLDEVGMAPPPQAAKAVAAEEGDGAAPQLNVPRGWKISQSGRRKQDWGPGANFKKRKAKLPPNMAMPAALQGFLGKVTGWVDDVAPLRERPYLIVEASCLDYSPAAGSNLDPHIDDTFMWGPRVAGVSMLAPSVITFVKDTRTSVHVLLQPRASYVISGPSRYEWLHGIRAEHVGSPRRISITMRELSDTVSELDPAICERIRAFARTFA